MKKKYLPRHAGNHEGDIPSWHSPRKHPPKGTLFLGNTRSVSNECTIPASPINVRAHRETGELHEKPAPESPSSLGEFHP